MKRFLIALAGIVAALAISVGIKDYVKQQKEAKPAASTSTPTVVDSNTITVPKKTTSAKSRQARMSATEANAPGTALAAGDEMEKPRISDEFPKAGAKKAAIDSVPNTVSAQAAHDDAEATALLRAQCLPLPNGTKRGDVDAAYYKNWAREYACLIP